MGVLHSMKGCSSFLRLLCLASSSLFLCCASYANRVRVEAKCNANGRWHVACSMWQVASGKWKMANGKGNHLTFCEGTPWGRTNWAELSHKGLWNKYAICQVFIIRCKNSFSAYRKDDVRATGHRHWHGLIPVSLSQLMKLMGLWFMARLIRLDFEAERERVKDRPAHGMNLTFK